VINSSGKDTQKKFLVRCCFIEIYKEEIKDLLGDSRTDKKLQIKETTDSGVHV